jgi:hypothetical protein
MSKLILGICLFLLVPGLKAQQEPPTDNSPQAASQNTTENSDARNAESEAIKRGHPLDPADVDILTGKKDRELEASRRPAVSVVVGGYEYGNYGDPYAIYGQRGGMFDMPPLPLTRISNRFFFFNMPPRGFGRGGFRGGR